MSTRPKLNASAARASAPATAPAQPPTPATVETAVDKLRRQYIDMASTRLETRVLPDLDVVIAATPTGPARELLTHANIVLQHASTALRTWPTVDAATQAMLGALNNHGNGE